MFDPHRVGPSSSSYYERNKGRVLQRKLVDPVSEPLTRSKLLSYLPIMRLNGIVDTPIVQHFQSTDTTFSFDSDTYLATGSTVTFNGVSGVLSIDRLTFIKSDQTEETVYLNQFMYSADGGNALVGEVPGGGYLVFLYISFNTTSHNYSFHTEAVSEDTGDSTLNHNFPIPANTLWYALHNQQFPISFQLFTSSGTGLLAYYSPTNTDKSYGVLNAQYFHFDDDRLGVN